MTNLDLGAGRFSQIKFSLFADQNPHVNHWF